MSKYSFNSEVQKRKKTRKSRKKMSALEKDRGDSFLLFVMYVFLLFLRGYPFGNIGLPSWSQEYSPLPSKTSLSTTTATSGEAKVIFFQKQGNTIEFTPTGYTVPHPPFLSLFFLTRQLLSVSFSSHNIPIQHTKAKTHMLFLFGLWVFSSFLCFPRHRDLSFFNVCFL